MAERIKEPVNNGVAKVPAIMQLEALECGAVCLAMVLAYYEKWIPIEKVRADCGVSRDGSNAGNIANAARYYGLEPMPYSYELEDIKNYATFPCIIHWKFNHFVVLKGFKHNHAYINDPARGSRVVDMKTFDESFTGVCIEFVPKKDFEPSGEERKALSYIKGRLKNYTKTISLMAAIGAVLSVVQIMKTAMSGVFIDSLLSGNRPEWVKPYFTIMIIICLVQIVTSLINSLYSIIARGKIDVMGSSSFMWKMLRLPIDFFSQRLPGDLVNRSQSNQRITAVLILQFAPLALDFAAMVFYLALMIQYNLHSRSCNPAKFTEIYHSRLKYKAEKNPLQAPLKIVLNSTYGAMKDRYNPLYDPRQANRVCVHGQLLLLDLMEHLEAVGAEIIQSNTDGVLVKMPSEYLVTDEFKEFFFNLIDDVAWEWEQRTRLKLEFDEFTKVYQKDVNNYVMVMEDGSYKSKGGYVKKLGALDYDLAIVNKAVTEYLLHGTPVEATISACNDLKSFQMVARCSGKYSGFLWGSEVLNERTVRVFASKNHAHGGLVKIHAGTGKPAKVASTPEHCFIVNSDVNGKKVPPNLDKKWYCDLALKRLNDFGVRTNGTIQRVSGN